MKEEISKLLKTAKQFTLKMFIDYQSPMYLYILFINYYNNFSLKYYFFLFLSFFFFYFSIDILQYYSELSWKRYQIYNIPVTCNIITTNNIVDSLSHLPSVSYLNMFLDINLAQWEINKKFSSRRIKKKMSKGCREIVL